MDQIRRVETMRKVCDLREPFRPIANRLPSTHCRPPSLKQEFALNIPMVPAFVVHNHQTYPNLSRFNKKKKDDYKRFYSVSVTQV